MRIIVAIGMALLSCSAHAAAPYYSWTEGNWSVGTGPGQCVAVNRPLAEFNIAPFVALMFIQKAGGEPRIRVHFWPGAFAKGESVSLKFDFFQSATPNFATAGSAINDYSVELAQPFPHRDLAQLAKADRVLIKADDKGKQVGFNLAALRAVIFHLDACGRRLAEK